MTNDLNEDDSGWSDLRNKLWTLQHNSGSLRSSIENSQSYRANPKNAYHGHYQRAINRQFSLFLHIFPMLWAWIFYGYAPAIAFTIGVLIVYVGLVVFHMVREITDGLLKDVKLFFIYGIH